MKVRVYWNLHKDCYSVLNWEKGSSKGRLLKHADSVNLKDVSFIVQPAGVDRVRSEKVKNVHAFVEGTLSDEQTERGVVVTYNPYTMKTFQVKDTGREVLTANSVRMSSYFSDGRNKALVEASI